MAVPNPYSDTEAKKTYVTARERAINICRLTTMEFANPDRRLVGKEGSDGSAVGGRTRPWSRGGEASGLAPSTAAEGWVDNGRTGNALVAFVRCFFIDLRQLTIMPSYLANKMNRSGSYGPMESLVYSPGGTRSLVVGPLTKANIGPARHWRKREVLLLDSCVDSHTSVSRRLWSLDLLLLPVPKKDCSNWWMS
ncbi:hypothetical protein MUK42_37012 [Musa troglodytarum]|uniref:Uncharacterized protein n=1 Tax=Musa troglodytarum TaxID=320322 RepID=A0A9E7GDC7_9LILI|nr:hypothetical protein MUK42_37012 [Musa troglodytarum]